MRANATCIACQLAKQEKLIRQFPDEEKNAAYINEVLKVLHDHGLEDSAPALSMRIDEVYARYFPPVTDYDAIKRKFNRYMLGLEDQVRDRIKKAPDRLKEGIRYVCAGNYIDFGTQETVSDSILEELIRKAGEEDVDEGELACLKEDLAGADRLLYLTDNCGEIVMDKLLIELIKELYPRLEITALLRGGPVINDATLEDARETGLDRIVPCVGNGFPIPGTDLAFCNEETKTLLDRADVIIAKGQGNFEGLYGGPYTPYYLFLCKCELFVRRFGLAQYSSVFARQDHISIRGGTDAQ